MRPECPWSTAKSRHGAAVDVDAPQWLLPVLAPVEGPEAAQLAYLQPLSCVTTASPHASPRERNGWKNSPPTSALGCVAWPDSPGRHLMHPSRTSATHVNPRPLATRQHRGLPAAASKILPVPGLQLPPWPTRWPRAPRLVTSRLHRDAPHLPFAACEWPLHAHHPSRRLFDLGQGDVSSRPMRSRGTLAPVPDRRTIARAMCSN